MSSKYNVRLSKILKGYKALHSRMQMKNINMDTDDCKYPQESTT